MPPTSRNLVVMFADIAASTRLYDTLGNAEAQATIDRVIGIVRRICESGNGRVVKTIGDEVMASFPDAETAALAAIEIEQNVSRQRTSRGTPIAIHIGMESGPAIEDDGDVFGDCVNVAARLTDLAKGGQIFTSVRTASELRSWASPTSLPTITSSAPIPTCTPAGTVRTTCIPPSMNRLSCSGTSPPSPQHSS